MDYTNLISNIIIKKKTKNPINISPSSFRLLFEYTEDMMNTNTNLIITENIRSCMEGIMHYKTDINGLIQKSIETSDTYSLGITLSRVANLMYKNGAFLDDEYINLHQFFKKLFDFNVFTRWNNIDAILDDYESVLRLNGVLGRLGKKFRNHSIVSEKRKPSVRAFPHVSAAHTIGLVSPIGLARTRRCIKKPKSNTCPPGKMRNPETRRCVKICPPDKIRRNGRCVKLNEKDILELEQVL